MKKCLLMLFIMCYHVVTFAQWSGTITNRTSAHFNLEVWESGSLASSSVLPLGDGITVSGTTSGGLVILKDASGSNIIGSALFIPSGRMEIGPDFTGNLPVIRENPDEPSNLKWVFITGFGTGVGIFGFAWSLKIAKGVGRVSDL